MKCTNINKDDLYSFAFEVFVELKANEFESFGETELKLVISEYLKRIEEQTYGSDPAFAAILKSAEFQGLLLAEYMPPLLESFSDFFEIYGQNFKLTYSPKDLSKIVKAVVKDTSNRLKSKVKETKDVPAHGIGLEVNEDTDARKAKTLGEIFETFLSGDDLLMQRDFLDYFTRLVKKSTLDTQVVDGSASGLESEKSFEDLIDEAAREVYDIHASQFNKKVVVRDPGGNILMEVFAPDSDVSKDSMFTSYTAFGEYGGAEIFTYEILKSPYNSLFNRAAMIRVLPGSQEEAYTAPVIEMLQDKDLWKPGMTATLEESTEPAEELPKRIKKRAKFVNIIANKFFELLQDRHPELMKTYKEKHRTGYIDKGNYSQYDQETKRVKYLKTSTPRVVSEVSTDGKVFLKQSEEEGYLTPQDFSYVAEEVSENATTLEELEAFIRSKAFDKSLKGQTKDIYKSIWYYYFSPEDYMIRLYDPMSETSRIEMHRSLKSILLKNSFKEMTLDEYLNNPSNNMSELLEASKGKNANLMDLLTSLGVTMNSTVSSERVIMDEGKLGLTQTGKSDVLARINEHWQSNFSIALYVGRSLVDDSRQSVYYVKKAIQRRLKSVAIENRKITISPTNLDQRVYNVRTPRNSKGEGIGIPVVIESSPGAPPLEKARLLLKSIYAPLGVPYQLFEPKNFQLFTQALEDAPNRDELGDRPIESYLLSFVYELKNRTIGNQFTGHINDNLWGFQEPLVRALTKAYGSTSKQQITMPNGDVMAVNTPGSRISYIRKIVKNIGKLGKKHNGYHTFLGRQGATVSGVYYMAGSMVKNKFRRADMRTALEHTNYLMQETFAQRLLQSSKFNKVLVQIGVIADKVTQPLLEITGGVFDGTYKEWDVWPTDGAGKLSERIFRTQWKVSKRDLHSHLERSILDAWVGEKDSSGIRRTGIVQKLIPGISPLEVAHIKKARDLKAILDGDSSITDDIDLKRFIESDRSQRVAWEVVSSNFNLVENAELVKGEDGFATISPHLVSNVDLFRSPVEDKYVAKVKEVLYEHGINLEVDTIEELEEYFKNNMLGINPSIIDKSKIALPGNGKEINLIQQTGLYLVLNQEAIIAVKTLEGNDGAEIYLDTSKKMFDEYLKSIGYTKDLITDAVADGINRKSKFSHSKKTNKEQAFKALTMAYFYNQSVLGREASLIMNGGVYQYKPRNETTPIFNYSKAFTDGKFNATEIIKGAKEFAKSNENDPRVPFIEAVLNNKNFEGTSGASEKAKTLLMYDMAYAQDKAYADEVKRNGSLGTSGQNPILQDSKKRGFKLGESDKNVTYWDPQTGKGSLADWVVHILGKPSKQEADLFDGMQMAHPLWGIRLNNSLGNKESNFSWSGVPVKDITFSSSDKGYVTLQKKATLVLTNELVQNMTAEAEEVLKKMNRTIRFVDTDGTSGVFIAVPAVNLDGSLSEKRGDFANPVTDEMWYKNGAALGHIKDSDTGAVILAEDLLTQLENGLIDPAKFTEDLLRGRYLTDRALVKFRNVQDLWEYFGSTQNPKSWEQVAAVLGNYAGATKDGGVTLKNANYPLRDSYIQKITFKTVEKVGSRAVLPENAYTNPWDPDSDWEGIKDLGNGKSTQIRRWEEVSNRGQIVILNSAHTPDTTAQSYSLEEDTDEKDATLALVRQAIASTVLQGRSINESVNIKTALGTLSDVQLDILRAGLAQFGLDYITTMPVSYEEKNRLSNVISKIFNNPVASIDSEEDPLIQEILQATYRNYANEVLRRALEMRENAGVAKELMYDPNISYDMSLVMPLVQSLIAADYNSKAVQYRMPGGQLTLETAHTSYRFYNAGESEGLTRSDLNKRLYDGSISEDAEGYEMLPIPADKVKNITLSDMVVPIDNYYGFEANKPVPYAIVRNKLRESWLPAVSDFETYVTNSISDRFKSRMTKLEPITSNSDMAGNTLQWTKYYKTDTNGNRVEALDTDEYKAYAQLYEIAKLPDVLEVLDEYIQQNPPEKYLVKLLYFSTLSSTNPELLNYGLGHPSVRFPIEEGVDKREIERDLSVRWTSQQEAEFENWWTEVNTERPETLPEIHRLAYIYAHTNASWLSKAIEAKLDDKLSTENWVGRPAEFLMPHMHSSAFYIKSGDSLVDIVGPQAQPDWRSLVEHGILDYGMAFAYNNGTLSEELIDEDNLTESQMEVLNTFRARKEQRDLHMTTYFRNRVREVTEESQLFNTNTDNPNEMLSILKAKRQRAKEGSLLHSTYTEMIKRVNEAIKERKTLRGAVKDATLRSIEKDIQGSPVQKYIRNKTEVLVNNFPQTLEFYTSRIPAQGKQSSAAGTIKAFIWDLENSIFGPAELLIIAGSDLDNDKQNNMTWQLDADGNVIDWSEYILDNNKDGKVDKQIVLNKIEQKEQEIDDKYDRELNSGELSYMDTYKLKGRILDEKQKARQALLERFAGAVKNQVVYNLIKIQLDPKNAIEANTPVLADKLKALLPEENLEKVTNAKTPGEALIASNLNIADDPSTHMKYFKIAADGKRGISIHASNLRAYQAAYYGIATAEDTDIDNIKIKSQFGNNVVDVQAYLQEKYGVEDEVKGDAIQFFIKDAEGNIVGVQNIETIANLRMYYGEGKEVSERIASLKRKLVIAQDDDQAQIALFMEHFNDLKMFDSMLIEEQVWEDMSQLITAATDNVKELILGSIGANNTTNGVIATMVRMGVDIKNAIDLLNEARDFEGFDPKDKSFNVIDSVEGHSNPLIEKEPGQTKYFYSLLKAVDHYTKSHKSFTTKQKIEDPLFRLHPFLKIDEEFAGITLITQINGGIPVPAFDGFKSIKTLESHMNKLMQQGLSRKKYEEAVKFDLERFVRALKGQGDPRYVSDTIGVFNSFKTGINVPFILKQNPQLSNYFMALFESRAIRDNVSSIYSAVETVFDDSISSYDLNLSRLTYGVYQGMLDDFYGFTVDKFFNDNPEIAKIIYKSPPEKRTGASQYDNEYDLSRVDAYIEPTSGRIIYGRREFVRDMPEIIEDLLRNDREGSEMFINNPFVINLTQTNTAADYNTKDLMTLLEGVNLRFAEKGVYESLQLGANQLANGSEVERKLYDLLFLYSLITKRAKYGGRSFASLFQARMYTDFMKYLNSNVRKKLLPDYLRSENRLTISFNNKGLLATRSTRRGKIEGDGQPSEELIDLNDNQNYNEDEEGLDFAVTSHTHSKKSKYISRESLHYLGKMNSEKRSGKFDDNEFKSKETGIAYIWVAELERWVPMVARAPYAVIPFTSNDNITELSKQRGWDLGYEVPYNDGTGTGNKVTVYGYLDNDYFYRLKNTPALASKFDLSTMIDRTKNPKGELDKIEWEQDLYIVKISTRDAGPEATKYKIMRADTLNSIIDSSKSILVLKGQAMYLDPLKGERKKFIREEIDIITDENGKLKESSPSGGVANLFSQTFVVPFAYRLNNKSNAVPVNDKSRTGFLSSIGKNSKGRIQENLSEESINKEYNETRLLYAEKLMGQQPFSITYETIQDIINEETESRGALAEIWRNEVKPKVDTYFPKNVNLMSKIQILNSFRELPGLKITKIEKGKVPRAYLEILNSESLTNIHTIQDIKEIIYTVGKNTNSRNSLFNKYLDEVFDETLYKMYIEDDGTIKLDKNLDPISTTEAKPSDPEETKDRVDMGFQLTDQNERRASRQALNSLAKRLNSMFEGTTFRVMNTKAIETVYKKKNAKSTMGFVKNGVVVFNSDNMTLSTALHEYSHIYFEYLKKQDYDTFLKLVDMALQTELASEMRNNYNNLSEVDLGEEVLVEMIARQMVGNLSNSDQYTPIVNALSTKKRFGKIQKFFQWLSGKLFGQEITHEINLNDSLHDIMQSIGEKMLYSKESFMGEFDEQTRKWVSMSRQGSQITIKEAEAFLKEAGYIKKICV